MLSIINGIKVITNNEKKMIEIRVSSIEELNKIQEKVSYIKETFKQYNFFINIDNKYRVDDIEINELDKFSNHVNQRVKLLLLFKQIEERKTKNGKYFYIIIAQLAGKRKYIKANIFNDVPLMVSKDKYYIVDGKIELGDSKYIKKNQKALGKIKDYQLKISSLEEYEFKEEEIEKKYDRARSELHLHTSFSKNDAFITTKDIEKAFDSNKVKTLALTDHGAVFSFIPYINALKEKYKETDKKIILGSEFYTVDYNKYQEKIIEELNNLDLKEEELKNTDNNFELEELNNELTELKNTRTKLKRFTVRKTISEEERTEKLIELEILIDKINEITERIKEIKNLGKSNELELIEIENKRKYYNSQVGKIDDIDRDHLTVLLKTSDTEIDYRGEKLTINLGLVELYKLISMSYKKYFSAPTLEEFKKQGKRPVLPYHELFKEGIRENFIVTSACAFGKHMKLAIDNKWDEFRKWIHNLDAVEIQPSWNNSYMVTHEDYPNITKMEDVYNLHRNIYQVCKEENVPCIITSDAHVNSKEDRIFRAKFKEGYISLIKSFAKEDQKNASGDEDFSIEKQPFIMSYDDVLEDYQKQGFSIEEIEEMLNNSDKIADKCINGFDITLLPKKLFLPDFPNIDASKLIPEMAWEFIKNKYSTDGTYENIEPLIKERMETELSAVLKTGFSVLYYVAWWMCKKSESKGYIVGSRGSAGSMLLTYALKIGENNPLPPHYYCPNCKTVEWVDTDLVGLDLPNKECKCGCMMDGDGLNIEAQNFVGNKLQKIPDIDLNFSEDVQSEIHETLIETFGKENAIKSGTQGFYQQDALIKDIFRHIPNIQQQVNDESFDIEYMSNEINTMRTTGQHPGGILLKPSDIPFEYITPLVNVADKENGESSSFTEYHLIEEQLIKIDALGHSDPTMLKELHETTGKDFRDIKFNDSMLYDAILKPELLGIDKEKYPFPATTMAISEMNTDFTMQMLSELQPKSMTDLIYFSGLSHGTGVWNGNIQRELVMSGKRKLNEVIPVRDIIFQQMTKKYGFDDDTAFAISESVRKGKGIKKWETEINQKCPSWYVEIMKGINYLFPKAHAAAYITNALRILHYKIYYPQQFYAAAVNRYGITDNNNSTFDYIKTYSNLNSIDDLYKLHAHIEHSTDNPAKEKSQKRIANIIWEMKIRGFEIHSPDFTSKADRCIPSKLDKHIILLPLQSISGVGPSAAIEAAIAHETYGNSLFVMSRKELSELVITKDGKNKKAFGKKFLDAYFGAEE